MIDYSKYVNAMLACSLASFDAGAGAAARARPSVRAGPGAGAYCVRSGAGDAGFVTGNGWLTPAGLGLEMFATVRSKDTCEVRFGRAKQAQDAAVTCKDLPSQQHG